MRDVLSIAPDQGDAAQSELRPVLIGCLFERFAASAALQCNAISCPKSTLAKRFLCWAADGALKVSYMLIVNDAALQEFVEATKENSGLDMGKLGEQAGNRDPSALGEVKTPQGQDVSGENRAIVYVM